MGRANTNKRTHISCKENRCRPSRDNSKSGNKNGLSNRLTKINRKLIFERLRLCDLKPKVNLTVYFSKHHSVKSKDISYIMNFKTDT